MIFSRQHCSAQIPAVCRLSSQLTCHSVLRYLSSQNSAMQIDLCSWISISWAVRFLLCSVDFITGKKGGDVWLSAGFSDEGKTLPQDSWPYPRPLLKFKAFQHHLAEIHPGLYKSLLQTPQCRISLLALILSYCYSNSERIQTRG